MAPSIDSDTASADIDRLDAHIDKMLEPGQDKGKEERIIRAGSATALRIKILCQR